MPPARLAVRCPSVVGAEECGTAAHYPELGGIVNPSRTEENLAGAGRYSGATPDNQPVWLVFLSDCFKYISLTPLLIQFSMN